MGGGGGVGREGNVIRIIYYMKHSAACAYVQLYKRNIKSTFEAM